MQVTIIQQDIDKAKETYEIKGIVCQSCLIYQALKRNNVPVDGVAFDRFDLLDKSIHKLSKSAQQLTNSLISDWQSYIDAEIELPITQDELDKSRIVERTN